MTSDQVHKAFNEILEYYDSIPSPKFRHANLNTLKEKFQQLQNLKDNLGHDKAYLTLINGMSQIIANLNRYNELASMPKDRIWSNYSERGMNKVIPPILNCKGQTWPVERTDRWGNTCHISNGHWGAKNYRVMDAVGYMFLMKVGGDCLPKNSNPLFNDLYEIQQRENQLNSGTIPTGTKHYIRFTDDDFRKFTDCRYFIGWSGEYIKYGKNLAAPRNNFALYSTPRILVRQIPNKPPYCIHACFISETIFNDRNSMNIINIAVEPQLVMAILNSRLMSYWFVHKFGKMQRGIFPQFKVNELAIFPMPCSFAPHEANLKTLVDSIITTKKQNPEADTSALEQQIDDLVYKLYELTDEEIAIVAGGK